MRSARTTLCKGNDALMDRAVWHRSLWEMPCLENSVKISQGKCKGSRFNVSTDAPKSIGAEA